VADINVGNNNGWVDGRQQCGQQWRARTWATMWARDHRIKMPRLFVPYPDCPLMEIMGDTIVLNKPVGYVLGQEEHRHMSAVRLLNRGNMHLA
jgi:hypothetical protein